MSSSNVNGKSLVEVWGRKTNRTPQRLKDVIKWRLLAATETQRKSKIGGSRHNSTDLTTYANSLLDGPLAPLADLVRDYHGQRSQLTHMKHEILQHVRRQRCGNAKQILQNMLINEYTRCKDLRITRTSDKAILSKFK